MTQSIIRRSVAAVILTGGQSSRMGRDKSLLTIRGKTWAAIAAEKALKAGCRPVVVAGPAKRYRLPQGVERIDEAYLGNGPLSGVEAALRHVGWDCMVIPCDQPYLSIALLRRLRRGHDGRPSAVAGEVLPAIIPYTDLGRVQRCLATGKHALRPFLKGAREVPGGPRHLLKNVNRQEEM